MKKLLLIATSCAFLAGCMSNAPEYRAEQIKRVEEYNKNASALAMSEFKPLIPLCLDAVENGTIVSAKKMQSLGFTPATSFGKSSAFRKKRGDSAMDRINSKNTSFNVSQQGCVFVLGNYGSVTSGGLTLRKLLEAEGYAFKGKVKDGFLLTKGQHSLILDGYAYSGMVTTFHLNKSN
ncbi:hypothetical protein [uncultured Shimia sp.]|uniref:hypothetical protein n=1 Tax=uncultured Shimia sp. TaxID=573152 RepID=UPI0026381399|nr:hypothetical protein [uncultured Shimia sp.]